MIAAGQAQRLFEEDPWDRVVRIYDASNRHRWHELWAGNPVIAPPSDTRPFQILISAKYCRPYIVYPFTAQTGWTFNTAFKAREHRARLYLTEAELALGYVAQERHGPYVLIEPYSKHVNLRWPVDRWQALVDARRDLTFVQHTHGQSPHLERVWTIPSPTFRIACGLVASAALYVRSESGMVHAAAALRKKTVTIWGACMDWDVLGGYPGQIGLVNYTTGGPCGRYLPCEHCTDAMAGISVEQVSAAIDHALAAEEPT